MSKPLKAPFPYFGGKSKIAPLIWERFGRVANYVEPFFGSGAVLLGCPWPGHTETVNDADGLLCNFWRALQADPDPWPHTATTPSRSLICTPATAGSSPGAPRSSGCSKTLPTTTPGRLAGGCGASHSGSGAAGARQAARPRGSARTWAG